MLGGIFSGESRSLACLETSSRVGNMEFRSWERVRALKEGERESEIDSLMHMLLGLHTRGRHG